MFLKRVLIKIEKHSSSCKGERYSVLFLLISRLTVAGQSPAYPVLYASLQRKLGSNSAGIAYFAIKTDLADCHCAFANVFYIFKTRH